MPKPRFSIVLTTYDRPEFLRQAVDSVLAQSFVDWEMIVIDDAGPRPIRLHTNDPRIRVVRRSKNGGLAASRNTGIDAARGTYIGFLDDDDLYTSDRLDLALRGLSEAPIAICWSRYFTEPEGRPKRVLTGYVHDEILDAITPHTAATVVHRDTIVAFDESYEASQDIEWWLRLSQRGPVATTPDIGYLIRQHAGPRHRNTRRARVDASLRLLTEDYRRYFATHPKAAAFRWKRVGIQALALGDNRLARRAFVRSFFHRRDLRTLTHLVRPELWRLMTPPDGV